MTYISSLINFKAHKTAEIAKKKNISKSDQAINLNNSQDYKTERRDIG